MTYENNHRSIKAGPGVTISTNGTPVGTGIDTIMISADANYVSNYGTFYSTLTQSNNIANTSHVATFNTSMGSKGVRVVSGTDITFDNPGTYAVILNVQVAITQGGPGTFSVWLLQNGNTVGGSNSIESIEGGGRSDVLSKSFSVITELPNEHVQVLWSCTSSNGLLQATPAQSNPTRPSTPSVSIVVHQL